MATIFGQTVPDADPVAMIGARGATADGTGIEAAAVSVLDTAGNYTATDVEAVLAGLPSRFAPALFTVDSYLPAGVTPSTATSAQTLAAYNSARDAAFAVGGTVKFTPGRTYQIDDTFITICA